MLGGNPEMNSSLIQEEVDFLLLKLEISSVLFYFNYFYVFLTIVAPKVFDESNDGGNASGNAAETISSKFDY